MDDIRKNVREEHDEDPPRPSAEDSRRREKKEEAERAELWRYINENRNASGEAGDKVAAAALDLHARYVADYRTAVHEGDAAVSEVLGHLARVREHIPYDLMPAEADVQVHRPWER